MQKKTEMMLNKVNTLLMENNYISADEIAKNCKLSKVSIFRIIRLLRLQGIGIIPTKKGYILSQFAQKSDDVGIIRRCMGRRASDIITLRSIQKDLQSRWQGIEEKKAVNSIFTYLAINPTNAETANKNMKYMLTYVNGKGN